MVTMLIRFIVDYFAIHTNIKLLHYTPETTTTPDPDNTVSEIIE